MSQIVKGIHLVLLFFGFDPKVLWTNLKGIPFLVGDYRKFKKQRRKDDRFPFGRLYPIMNDRGSEAGSMKGHYYHQDLYVAQKIYARNPIKHLDIGSRIDGFVAHVATFREIEIIDIRPVKSNTENISFKQFDLMQLPDGMVDYCDSVSSLHAIEHFGLGRYGDPIDYNGHVKAIENIVKILKAGGTFYFSTPIGHQRVNFNAQRIFSISYLKSILEADFEIFGFSYVDDAGDFHPNVELTETDVASNFNCSYGCGIFELKKK